MAVPIVMPNLGMYTIEGELTNWLVPEGATVEKGQPVLELTTEKVTVEIQAPETGRVHQVLGVGGRVQVHALIGYVLAPGESLPTPTGQPGPAAVLGVPATGGTAGATPAEPVARVLRATPLARRRAAELGVDLGRVVGTGPGGRITENDVVAAVAVEAPSVPAVVGPTRQVLRRVRLAGMRRQIAERMRQSLAGTAQLTLTREVDASALLRAREGLLARAAELGLRVPYDALLARALAMGLGEQPALNSVVEGDEIVVLAEIHVGVAVAVEGGLVVPVLRDAAHRSLLDLARNLGDLVARAREGRLLPDEMMGGTVTLTNLGAYGVDTFTPILNPPQSAVLGVGRIAPRPVVEEGQLVVRPTLHLSLTFDHRVADGAAAAALLEAIVGACRQLEPL